MAVRNRGNKLVNVRGTHSNTTQRSKLIGKVVNDAHQKYQDRQDQVLIKDWAGNILFKGHKDSMGVTKVLKANRCTACNGKDSDDCKDCMGTKYSGDFTVEWCEASREDNVYEHIGY